MNAIQQKLFSLKDEKYGDFTAKLTPNIKREAIIGVRAPLLRSLARELYKKGNYETFLLSLPHSFYEENNLHGFLISNIGDYDKCIDELNRFLPYVDNWATCDGLSPKVLKNEPKKLLGQIKIWLQSEYTYTVRFGVKCLMDFFLDENFTEEILSLVADVKSEEYYINMCCAWFFATALAKQHDSTLPYIREKKLNKWVHNKTIQKAVESYRISDDIKAYLKELKIK